MKQVPKLIFNDGEAVADVCSCREATALRDFFWKHDFEMKSQNNQGQLTLRVPNASAKLPDPAKKMELLYEQFCQQAGLEITL